MTSNGGFPVSVFALFLCVSVEKTIECHQSVTQDLKGLFTSMKQALIYNGKKSKNPKKPKCLKSTAPSSGSDC